MLPETLQLAIEKEIDRFGFQEINQARKELTERYRNPFHQTNFMTEERHRIAYLATRMPATFTVIKKVFNEINHRISLPIKSVLDLGAGPGTSFWAAQEIFQNLEKMTLVELDGDLIQLGQRLYEQQLNRNSLKMDWIQANIEQLPEIREHDLILLSYSINELSPEIIPNIIDVCWKRTKNCLVVIEPGTPAGFERIRAIRNQLIELGACIVAPCPGSMECPMAHGDWCHFSERVERTSFHRRIKEGTLGYEDEKYSYIAVSKTPVKLPEGRILRHPNRHSGHLDLTLCTLEGLKKVTISKRHGELYKKARKAEWGDTF